MQQSQAHVNITAREDAATHRRWNALCTWVWPCGPLYLRSFTFSSLSSAPPTSPLGPSSTCMRTAGGKTSRRSGRQSFSMKRWGFLKRHQKPGWGCYVFTAGTKSFAETLWDAFHGAAEPGVFSPLHTSVGRRRFTANQRNCGVSVVHFYKTRKNMKEVHGIVI